MEIETFAQKYGYASDHSTQAERDHLSYVVILPNP